MDFVHDYVFSVILIIFMDEMEEVNRWLDMMGSVIVVGNYGIDCV